MVTQENAIKRLGEERDYEDRLVHNLSDYFIAILDKIPDLTEEERNKVRCNLSIIVEDSKYHRLVFDELVMLVLNGNFDSY